MAVSTIGRWHDRGYLRARALEDLQVVVNTCVTTYKHGINRLASAVKANRVSTSLLASMKLLQGRLVGPRFDVYKTGQLGC